MADHPLPPTTYDNQPGVVHPGVHHQPPHRPPAGRHRPSTAGRVAQTGVRLATAGAFLTALLLYVISIGLASYALNEVLNNGQVQYIGTRSGVATVVGNGGNVVTPIFALVTLIAGMVGLAAVLLGLQHVMSWNSRVIGSSANAATMIALLLSFLAMGLACKEISLGGYRKHRLRALEAFAIITPFVMLLPALLMHLYLMTRRKHDYDHDYDRDYEYGRNQNYPVGDARARI